MIPDAQQSLSISASGDVLTVVSNGKVALQKEYYRRGSTGAKSCRHP